MSERNYETRHIFMAMAIVIAIYSPIFLFFIPQTLLNIFHQKSGVWHAFVPEENFWTCGIGFFLLFISSMILYLMDIKKASIITSSIFVFFSACCFFTASQSYKVLAEDYISYSPTFSLKDYRYSWSEIDTIVTSDEDGTLKYEFIFNDGKSMTLEYDAYFRTISRLFNYKVKEMNIVFESK